MEIIGLFTGPFIYFYGGAFFRWIFVYNMKRSFKDIYDNEKEENTRLSRLILLIYVIIAISIISL